MSLNIQYERLRDARWLYGAYKRLRAQIPDEKVDTNKTYKVEIQGKTIIAMIKKSMKKYRQCGNLEKAGY